MLYWASTLLIRLNIGPTKCRNVTELGLFSGVPTCGRQMRALWICQLL
jgi:hypothetical protein